jgi:putative membrane protein
MFFINRGSSVATCTVALCCSLWLGCDDDDDARTDRLAAQMTTEIQPPTAGAGGSRSPGPTRAEGPQLDDPQIIAILVTVNNGEIEQGKVAMMRADAEEVTEYANSMIADHAAANEQLMALVGQLRLTAIENQVSDQLVREAALAQEMFNATPDDDFDTVYMSAQVMQHQRVLALMDESLIPNVQQAQLRSLMETLRASVSDHLERAREILEEL